jgi:hypothetical protein
MTQTILKFVISAAVIVAVLDISKRNSLISGLLACYGAVVIGLAKLGIRL